MAIGINWKEVWKDVWKDVWQQTASTSHTATGALTADSATVAGTAEHLTLHSSTGALSAQEATVAGTAAHLTLHTATGALIADAATISGAAVDESTYVAPTPQTGGGRSRKRRRYTVEVDGQEIAVESAQEAEAILKQVREQAEEAAEKQLARAANAQKRPARKVVADARKALEVPQIVVPPEFDAVAAMAQALQRDISQLFRSTINTIEIGALLRRQQAMDDDDEDVLLMML